MEWFPKYIAECERSFIECHFLCRKEVKWENMHLSAWLCRKKQKNGKSETTETGYFEMIGRSRVEKIMSLG